MIAPVGRAACAAALLCVVVALNSCSRKKPDVVARVGGDTLTGQEVRGLAPDLVADTQQLSNALVRIALARTDSAPPDSGRRAQHRTLSRQLSLLGSTQWSDTAAGLLLDAARALAAKANSTRSKADVAAYVDSLFASIAVNVSGAAVKARILGDSLLPDSLKPGDDYLPALISLVFGLPDHASVAVAEHLQPPTARDDADVGELVKGLVYDRAQRRPSTAPMPQVQRDNSVVAIRYRGQGSIRDSIGRHIPNLQELYKKHLKTNSAAGGTVWVVLRVNASGQVIAAEIKSTDIRDAVFTGRFLSYVKTIRFQPIPEKVGTMRFEFPFEFTADEG